MLKIKLPVMKAYRRLKSLLCWWAVAVLMLIGIRLLLENSTVQVAHEDASVSVWHNMKLPDVDEPEVTPNVRIPDVAPDSETPDIMLLKSLPPSRCPTLRRPSSVSTSPPGTAGAWQRHLEGAVEVLVYSAFYDDRPLSGLVPKLRLLAVSTSFKETYCQVWYAGRPVPHVTKVTVLKSGRGDSYNGSHYDQLLLTCDLPSARPLPTHVSLGLAPCSHSSIYMSIIAPNRALWQQEFGVCVAVAFDHVDTQQIIEWVELTRIMGVSHIHVYNATVKSEHDPLFQYYARQGLMTVHPMPPPVPLYDKKGAKFGSPASLNDCMMRHMFRYRYVVVVDFDEVIVPKSPGNYSDLLRAIDKTTNKPDWPSYTFRNVYFFRDLPADKSQDIRLSTLAYRTRAEPSDYMYTPKSFIDPRRCLSVFNHYCYVRFPGTQKPFTIDVPVSLATSHHYKPTCNLGQKTCAEILSVTHKDDLVLRYKVPLILGTNTTRKALGLS